MLEDYVEKVERGVYKITSKGAERYNQLSRAKEGERKLNKQVVSALEAKIKEQEAYIRQLTQKTDQAGQQVQNIALKAIEGASSQRIFGRNYENVKEGIKDQ